MNNTLLIIIASALFILWTVICGGVGYIINQYLKTNYFGGWLIENILRVSPFISCFFGIYVISHFLGRFYKKE